jgi:hypothetical protein
LPKQGGIGLQQVALESPASFLQQSTVRPINGSKFDSFRPQLLPQQQVIEQIGPTSQQAGSKTTSDAEQADSYAQYLPPQDGSQLQQTVIRLASDNNLPSFLQPSNFSNRMPTVAQDGRRPPFQQGMADHSHQIMNKVVLLHHISCHEAFQDYHCHHLVNVVV